MIQIDQRAATANGDTNIYAERPQIRLLLKHPNSCRESEDGGAHRIELMRCMRKLHGLRESGEHGQHIVTGLLCHLLYATPT